jgi:hypothetical protein
MPTHATALFGDRHAAHAAVEQLVQAGFPRDAISVVMSEPTHEREFAALAEGGDASCVRPARTGVLTTILAGLVVLRCRCGLTLRAAGPLVAELVREAAQGALLAALAAAGLADPQARFVDEGVRSGAIVVGVHASADRVRLATQLLALSGGSALEAA